MLPCGFFNASLMPRLHFKGLKKALFDSRVTEVDGENRTEQHKPSLISH